MNATKTAVIALALSGLTTNISFAAQYPPNIDYGQQGDFITKRATENGRAAIIMPIGPVLVLQPETPGSSSHGFPNGLDMVNVWLNLSDLTDPKKIAQNYCEADNSCKNSMPIQAHGTVLRVIDDEAVMREGPNWLGFDSSQSTSENQMVRRTPSREEGGRVVRYAGQTSNLAAQINWSYGNPPEGDYFLRDAQNLVVDSSDSEAWQGAIHTTWDHSRTGVSGFPIFSGNLMIYASDQQQTGLAAYDISGYKQGIPPRLLSVFNPTINKPPGNNGVDERIGGYWMEPYGTNKVVFAARKIGSPVNREFSALFVVDFSDPTDMKLTCEVYFDQTDSFNDGDVTSNTQYVNFQDQYAFTDHFKVDIEKCEELYADDNRYDPAIPAIVQDNENSERDEFHDVVYRYNDIDNSCDGSQYYRPLGQVGVFGGYNASETKMTIEYTGAQLPRGRFAGTQRGGITGGGGAAFSHLANNNGNRVAGFSGRNTQIGDLLEPYDGLGTREVTYVAIDQRSNEQGLCFAVMHDEPDTRKPYISGHMPRANATNVPVDTMIHAHMPETIRSETLPGSVVVRNNQTNEIIEGLLQISHTGTIGFFPENNLSVDTTYTVSISGIQDFMGNTMDPTSFSFTTGSSLVATPPPVVVEVPETAPDFGSDDLPGTPYFANQSSQISCENESYTNNIWTVNPDNNSISVINTSINPNTGIVEQIGGMKEIFVNYNTPTSITNIGTHYAVTFRDDDQIVFFNANQQPEFSFNTGYGTQPVSAVTDDNKEFLYVALYGSGEVIKLDLRQRANQQVRLVGKPLKVGPTPKAMTYWNHRLLVTRYISAQNYGEVYDINTGNMSLRRTIRVNKVTINDDIDNGSGVPNFLSGVVISEDGTRAYVSAAKMNTDNADLDDDNTVRAMVATLNLSSGIDINEGDTSNKLKSMDLDNAADPSAITLLPDGVSKVITLQGNNQVDIIRSGSNAALVSHNTGFAPQSLCTTLRTLYVKNYSDRSITAIDISQFMSNGSKTSNKVTIKTVNDQNEILEPKVLAGLKVFYHASTEMSEEGYMSCGSCHQDGGQDGRVWNLASLGEGLRNTLALNGTSGTRFGNLHWSQNFDEVQDFELQIEKLNRSKGLIPGENTFKDGDSPLTKNTSNISEDLDALAAYISSLGKSTVKRSPIRDFASGELNFEIFNELGCADCHSGAAFRDGLAHDVGTIDPNDNQAYGQAGGLTQIRTPTLVDLFETAPYFHNGSAETLEDVLNVTGTVHDVPNAFQPELIEFLKSIDRSMFIEDDVVFVPGSP